MTVIDRSPEAPAVAPDRTARLTIFLASGADPRTALLQGEIDLASEDALRRALGAALATAIEVHGRPSRARGLVLDLSGLDFCSLGGLFVLMDTVEAGRFAGVPVTVSGASAALERLWRLAAARPATPPIPRRRSSTVA